MKVTNNAGKDLKAINVEDYIVIVDTSESIKNKDFYLNNNTGRPKRYIENSTAFISLVSHDKIIATIGKRINKSIPLIKFSEGNKEELILNKFIKAIKDEFKDENWEYLDFIKDRMLNDQAKSSDKKYSFDEMLKLIDDIAFIKTTSEELNSKDYQPFITDEDGDVWTINKEELIQSLNQPTLPLEIHLEFEDMLQVRHGVEWCDLPNQKEGRETDGIYQKIQKLKTTTSPEGEEIIITI